mmetsp:Transcript_24759/g.58029  ORF Transcript_24759/g.58029 Transcript_24759/m.58029 type:complete len:408 (+) Transcript_24759:24-1247(+)
MLIILEYQSNSNHSTDNNRRSALDDHTRAATTANLIRHDGVTGGEAVAVGIKGVLPTKGVDLSRCRVRRGRETEAEVGNARHDAPIFLVGEENLDSVDSDALRTERGDVVGILRALVLVTGLAADGIDLVPELDEGLVAPGRAQISSVRPRVGFDVVDLDGLERRARVHGKSTGHVRLGALGVGDGMDVASLGLHGTLVANHNGRRVSVQGTGHVDGEEVRQGVGIGIEGIVPTDDIYLRLVGVGEGAIVARQPRGGDAARCRPGVGLRIIHVHLANHGVIWNVPSSDQPKLATGINSSMAIAGPGKLSQRRERSLDGIEGIQLVADALADEKVELIALGIDEGVAVGGVTASGDKDLAGGRGRGGIVAQGLGELDVVEDLPLVGGTQGRAGHEQQGGFGKVRHDCR